MLGAMVRRKKCQTQSKVISKWFEIGTSIYSNQIDVEPSWDSGDVVFVPVARAAVPQVGQLWPLLLKCDLCSLARLTVTVKKRSYSI
jgi:ribose 1,5-bisphosphokinase PhnN